MRIFVSAHYARKYEVIEFADKLRELGHTVDCRWLGDMHSIAEIRLGGEHGSVMESDGEIAQRLATECLEDVEAADAIILFIDEDKEAIIPSLGGRWVEFGFAVAKGKRLHVVGDRGLAVFTYLPGVTQHNSDDDCIYAFEQIRHRRKGG